MASRCIDTLNDLDKISNRIYRKYSKRRFCADIEAKLRAAREKEERSSQEIDDASRSCHKPITIRNRSSISATSCTLSSRYYSTSASSTTTATTSLTTSEHQKRTSKEEATKPLTTQSAFCAQRDQIQRRKTKSCPGCSLVNNNKKQSIDAASDVVKVARAASVFGKFSGKGSEYKPTAWFNLPLERSVGVIDSFACDSKKAQPLCYAINIKKGETEPRLLKHNLEVRVGQNGIVRTEKKAEADSEDDDREGRQGKKRTAPLSWKELLQWKNACIISSEPQTIGNSLSKSLCEQHPVIFHEKKSLETEKRTKRNEDINHFPSYRLSLDSRWISADRRNLVSSGNKCITSVEIEDCVDDEVVRREKSQPFESYGTSPGKERRRILNAGRENIPKKVSFEDEEAIKEGSISIEKAKARGKNEVRREEVAPIVLKTNDTEIMAKSNVHEIRPKTSTTWREKARLDTDEVMDVRKLRRPHTAPPAPSSSAISHRGSLYHNVVTIKIPTSQDEDKKNLPNSTNDSTGQGKDLIEFSECETPDEEKQTDTDEEISTFSVTISASSTPDSKATMQDGGAPTKPFTFGSCKSAPVSRTVYRNEQEEMSRPKSSTALERRPYQQKAPVFVESKSSLDLPKEMRPAQALLALRKLIRDDLAQQNRELQLDIQRLYLKKHAE